MISENATDRAIRTSATHLLDKARAQDFYYKSYPSHVIAILLLLLLCRVEIYNLMTFRRQAKWTDMSDIKCRVVPALFSAPLFADALYDMITNLDRSTHSTAVAIVFAVTEGVMFIVCTVLVKTMGYYEGNFTFTRFKCGQYKAVSTAADDDDDEDNDSSNSDEEAGNSSNSDDDDDEKCAFQLTYHYIKFNGYYTYNFTWGCLTYAFFACLTYIIKSIGISTFDEVLNDNLIVILASIMLGVLCLMIITDFVILNHRITHSIYTPYLVVFSYGCALLIDYHNKRRAVDLLMIIHAILALAASTVKLTQIAMHLDLKKNYNKKRV